MTIEIRQLIIRAVVNPRNTAVEPQTERALTRENGTNTVQTSQVGQSRSKAEYSALVADCVKNVLRELRRNRTR